MIFVFTRSRHEQPSAISRPVDGSTARFGPHRLNLGWNMGQARQVSSLRCRVSGVARFTDGRRRSSNRRIQPARHKNSLIVFIAFTSWRIEAPSFAFRTQNCISLYQSIRFSTPEPILHSPTVTQRAFNAVMLRSFAHQIPFTSIFSGSSLKGRTLRRNSGIFTAFVRSSAGFASGSGTSVSF